MSDMGLEGWDDVTPTVPVDVPSIVRVAPAYLSMPPVTMRGRFARRWCRLRFTLALLFRRIAGALAP